MWCLLSCGILVPLVSLFLWMTLAVPWSLKPGQCGVHALRVLKLPSVTVYIEIRCLHSLPICPCPGSPRAELGTHRDGADGGSGGSRGSPCCWAWQWGWGWSQLRLWACGSCSYICQCWVIEGAPHCARIVPKLTPVPSALPGLAALSSFRGWDLL